MEKEEEALLSSLSLEVVKNVAPGELDLFDDIKDEFLKNPDAFVAKTRPVKGDKMLAFDGAIAGEFVISAVLPVVWSVISFIAKSGIDSFKDAAAKRIGTVVSDTVQGKGSTVQKDTAQKTDPLSKERIQQIKACAIASAQTQGISEQQAEVIADIIIGKLVEM